VGSISESVEIEAPAERVWAVVHADFKNAPKWAAGLKRTEVLDPLPLRKGSRIVQHLDTPGGSQKLEIEHTAVTKPKTCAGELVGGPLRGTFKYSYAEKDGRTKLTYKMDYRPANFAVRLFAGVIDRQLPQDIAKTMKALKKYIESGKGPKATAAR
jgi:uncharacterized membrane protein